MAHGSEFEGIAAHLEGGQPVGLAARRRVRLLEIEQPAEQRAVQRQAPDRVPERLLFPQPSVNCSGVIALRSV